MWLGGCPAGTRLQGRKRSCIGEEEPAPAIVNGGRWASKAAATACARGPGRRSAVRTGHTRLRRKIAARWAAWRRLPAEELAGVPFPPTDGSGARRRGRSTTLAPAADGRRVTGRPAGRRSAQAAGRSSSPGGSTASACQRSARRRSSAVPSQAPSAAGRVRRWPALVCVASCGAAGIQRSPGSGWSAARRRRPRR